jgi:putative ABC transport system permease protein
LDRTHARWAALRILRLCRWLKPDHCLRSISRAAHFKRYTQPFSAPTASPPPLAPAPESNQPFDDGGPPAFLRYSECMLELAAAFRGLRRQTGFVLVAVFTLAVGTAALAIVFTIVNAVLLRPIPYKNPNRLAVVWEKRTSESGNWGVSGADFLDWRIAASSFQSMTAQTEFFANLTGTGEPERLLAVVSSVNMLDTYGAIPLHGRGFAPDDERSGHVALLAYGLWQRRFGGDPSAIGRTLQLDGNTYSIIGVLSPGFRMLYGQGPGDIYLPLVMTPT